MSSLTVADLLFGSRARRIFTLAMAAVALHILVDAFVAREPGVAWQDHLVAAAIQLAIIAFAVFFYGRLRIGLQAVIALVFGAWSLVGAGIAVYDARIWGPRGDDWTGFLLVPAGVALVALGAMLLWRSRKQTGRPYLRRTLLVGAAVLVVYYVVLPVGMAIYGTHKPRAPIIIGDLGQPAERITVRTSDGLNLAGTYVPSQNGAAVLLFPRNFNPNAHARLLVRHGYGVLMVDMRGQGESEGDPNAWGWGSTRDLDAAIAWLQARPDVKDGRIGGLGLSVGGEQLIEAAAANPGLRAVISEGTGMRSAREGLARTGVTRLQVWLQWPQDWVDTIARMALGGVLPPPSLVDLAPQVTPRPILFMLGEYDNPLEAALTPAYYAAAQEPKTLWVIPGAGHTAGLATQPQAYKERVISFFDGALRRSD